MAPLELLAMTPKRRCAAEERWNEEELEDEGGWLSIVNPVMTIFETDTFKEVAKA